MEAGPETPAVGSRASARVPPSAMSWGLNFCAFEWRMLSPAASFSGPIPLVLGVVLTWLENRAALAGGNNAKEK